MRLPLPAPDFAYTPRFDTPEKPGVTQDSTSEEEEKVIPICVVCEVPDTEKARIFAPSVVSSALPCCLIAVYREVSSPFHTPSLHRRKQCCFIHL